MSPPTSLTAPALPTSDIRSSSKASARARTHNAKWSRGSRPAAGKHCPHPTSVSNHTCTDCAVRPLLRDSTRNNSAHFRVRSERAIIHSNNHAHRTGAINHRVLRNDLQEVAQGSDTGSSDEEVTNGSEAPLPTEVEVMYSYDAQAGPTDGGDVLSNAVMQAVKRFENKQTEQLVKKEYDLVNDGKEFAFEDADAYAGDGEDDFEVIDFEHLR